LETWLTGYDIAWPSKFTINSVTLTYNLIWLGYSLAQFD